MLAGETTAYFGRSPARSAASTTASTALPRGLRRHRRPVHDCLLLSDDFTQYYLGAFGRTRSTMTGQASPCRWMAARGSRPRSAVSAVADNPVDEAGAFRVTSDVLPADEFPQFASEAAASTSAVGPFIAIEGDLARRRRNAENSLPAPGPHRTTCPVWRPPMRRASRRSSPTPRRTDRTTCSWRPTSPARTTGRRFRRSAGRPPTPCPRSARPASCSHHPWLEHYLTEGTRAPRPARPATGTPSPARRTDGPRSRSTCRPTRASRWSWSSATSAIPSRVRLASRSTTPGS